MIQDLWLEWDDVGNLEQRRELGFGSGFSSRDLVENFTYDDMNRLTGWSASGTFNENESYAYNNRDNLINKAGVTYRYGTQCSASQNAGPHALCRAGSTNYSYDNNGNMISGDGRTLEYGVFNKPTKIVKGSHTTEFAYGPDRQRYKRVDTNGSQVTTTLYIGSVEKIHYPDNTVHWRRQIGGVAIINEQRTSSGGLISRSPSYVMRDHLGSTSLLTDGSGAVTQEHYYDPWGQPRKPQFTSGSYRAVLDQPFRVALKPDTTRGYTNHEHLDEVGLIHMTKWPGAILNAAMRRPEGRASWMRRVVGGSTTPKSPASSRPTRSCKTRAQPGV